MSDTRDDTLRERLLNSCDCFRNKITNADEIVWFVKSELEGARAKAAEGAAPSFGQSEAEIEAIAFLANVPREALQPGFLEITPFAAIDVLEELQRRANVIAAQSSELAAWQPFADLLRSRWGMRDDEPTPAFADRLVHEQTAELKRLRECVAKGEPLP